MTERAIAESRPNSDHNPVVMLDTSGSMATPEGSQRRIDILRCILQQVLPTAPGARVIAFSSLPQLLTGLEPGRNLKLPEPGGSTALHLALTKVLELAPCPGRIVVISDGQPDDAAAALAAARALAPVVINALYAGPDNDFAALGFMRALSLAGGRPGVSGARSLKRPEELQRLLLGGPGR